MKATTPTNNNFACFISELPCANQNFSDTPNCRTRPTEAPVTDPNVEVPTVVPTLVQDAWLGRLKDSVRNSRLAASRILKTLNKDTSNVVKPGPVRIPRPELPHWPGVIWLVVRKAPVLN